MLSMFSVWLLIVAMSFMIKMTSGSESIIDPQCVIDLMHSWLPAFDLLVYLPLGLDNHVTQKLVDSQKQSMNPNHLYWLLI